MSDQLTSAKSQVNLFGLSKNDYRGNPSTLCQGCGHNSISSQIISACYELNVIPENVVKISGIGCSSKSPTYFLNRSFGFNGLLVALGGLPWVGALAAYNAAMTGNVLRLTTTPLTVSLWFRDGWLLRGADILSTHLVRHLLWTPPVLVLAYVLYLRVAPREARRGPLDWMLAITVAILYFYVERGGNQYGPRFHYEVFPFTAVFVVANVFRATVLEPAARDRRVFGLLVASVLVMPVSLAVHAAIERQVIVERMDPFTQAEQAGLQDALVLIGDRVGTARSIAASDLTRNGIDSCAPIGATTS